MLQEGNYTLQALSNEYKSLFVINFQERIQQLAIYNQNLRERAVVLERLEKKFIKLGGSDWMTSRFYPVICSVRVNRSEIKSSIEESLLLSDKLGYFCATLNGNQHDFHKGDSVGLEILQNYIQLNENFVSADSRHIRQRTEKWHGIRQSARVTGSTCFNALGLGKLKDQQKHYDKVVLKKVVEENRTEEEKRRLQFGVEHEIDAIATVCSKVLPYKYPELFMVEEGCVKINSGDQEGFMVVSPDGSLRENVNVNAKLAYENKCKTPYSYATSAYYEIPLYYVPQLLCEMQACQCEKLLFTCWAEQSMTVFEVKHDLELWEQCWSELINLYGHKNTSRPKRFTETSKLLKTKIKQFREQNTTLCAEFRSISVVGSHKRTDGHTNGPYIASDKRRIDETEIYLQTVLEVLSNLHK